MTWQWYLKSFRLQDKNLFYIVKIVSAGVLVTPGARTSTTMISTTLNLEWFGPRTLSVNHMII